MADTTATVRTTSQMLAPNVTSATPATTISFRNGPKTYSGEVAGSPPPGERSFERVAQPVGNVGHRQCLLKGSVMEDSLTVKRRSGSHPHSRRSVHDVGAQPVAPIASAPQGTRQSRRAGSRFRDD